jgi:undecaprenyl diphosphate synthase
MPPEHVAIIMDGNGRWAQEKGLPRTLGHKAGVKVLKKTVENAYALGIKYLSMYVFSSENWRRPKEEVDFLMKMLETLIIKEVKALHKKGVKVRFLGNTAGLSSYLQEKIIWAENLTQNNLNLQLNLLVNYGARQEIIHAVNALIENGAISISEADMSGHLYTHDSPDPDLIIRTGGETRLSNFLLWQAAYSEIWVTSVCWPDFNKKLLEQALVDFATRDRRFGGLHA